MFDSLTKINDGIQGLLDPINPLNNNINDMDKKMILALIQSGHTIEEVEHLLAVSDSQLREFTGQLRALDELNNLMKEETKPKPATRRKKAA